MKTDKKGYLILGLYFFCFGQGSWAEVAGWKVLDKKDSKGFVKSLAVNPELAGIEIPLHSNFSDVEILDWRQSSKNKDLYLLRYDSGLTGTSQKYSIERQAVVDIKNKKVLGDAPVKYVPEGKAPPLDDPLWNWRADKIEIDDSDFGETYKIPLK